MKPSRFKVAWAIARRELIDQVSSLRYLAILLLVLLMTPLSIYVGVKDYEARNEDYEILLQSKQEFISHHSDKVYGVDLDDTAVNELVVLRVLRAPQPLSILTHGMDGELPKYWDFSELGIQPGPPASTISRLADTFQYLDFEFLIRAVLGLLAALLGYDAVVGEKEAGTLRASLSHPVSRRVFFTGKLLGGAITLMLALALAYATALLCLLWLAPPNLMGGELFQKLGMIGLTAAAYLICFYLLGLIVSSFAASQKTSLLVTLVTWFLLVLTVAPVATLIARAAVPVRTFQRLEAERQQVSSELNDEMDLEIGDRYRKMTGAPKGVISASDISNNMEELKAQIMPIHRMYLEKRRQRLKVLEQSYDRDKQQQQRIAHAIMMLSPALAFANACTDLAGTGDEHYRSWQSAITDYYRKLEKELFDRPPTVRITNSSASLRVRFFPAPSLESLPAFAPPRQDPAAALQRSLSAFWLLPFYIALFLLAGFAAFARYDVR